MGGLTIKAEINHVKTKEITPRPKSPHRTTPSEPPINKLKEHSKSYSEATRTGLKPKLQNAKTPKLQNPKTPKLQCSKTPKLQNSNPPNLQNLQNSKNPKLQISKTP